METTTFAATDGFPHPALVGVTGPEQTLAVQGDPHTALALASVSKPLSAWGALIAVERGLVDLDEPAGPEGATLLNLLDHTSGLPFEGETTQAAPGTRRIYSNVGFDAVGAHVAAAAGMSFAEWMTREVTQPLGMREIDVNGRPSAGYKASISDLLIFGREVLRPTLIPAALRDLALMVSREGLKGVVPGYGSFDDNQWGLGFERKGTKSPHWLSDRFPPDTAGHFGGQGSFFFVDRSRDIAAAFLSGVPFSDEHKRIWPPLTDEIVARYGNA